MILDERIDKRMLGAPATAADRGAKFGWLRIKWIGTIDTGDGGDGARGSLGNYHIQVWPNNSPVPVTDEILAGPTNDGWEEGDERSYGRGVPVFAWRNEEDSVKIGIYETEPQNESDYLFFGTIQRKPTLDAKGLLVGNRRLQANRDGVNKGAERIARRITDEFATLVMGGMEIAEARRRAEEAHNWPKQRVGLDFNWFAPGKHAFVGGDNPKIFVQFGTTVPSETDGHSEAQNTPPVSGGNKPKRNRD
jgi:hypothetical protein